MTVPRRVSAIFKDLPGGQVLGPTTTTRTACWTSRSPAGPPCRPHPAARLPPRRRPCQRHPGSEGLIEPDGAARPAADLTREPLAFPAGRATRLQALARGDEGFLLALGYSTQRG